MIELTVCLPFFRAQHIGWLVLESLCRQRGIDFEWELIIAQESFSEVFTKDKILKYAKRLDAVGCKRIKYLGFSNWVPLSYKLVCMLKQASKTSQIYSGAAADVYSPPERLKYQYDLLMNAKAVDWCAIGRSIVYDIASEKTYLNDSRLTDNLTDAVGRSIRMDIIKHFNVVHKKKGVDAAVFKFVQKYVEERGKKFLPFVDNETDNWKYGINVNGLNNITMAKRRQYFRGINRPKNIVKCPVDINKTIPPDIMDRLRRCKKILSQHNETGIRQMKIPRKLKLKRIEHDEDREYRNN